MWRDVGPKLLMVLGLGLLGGFAWLTQHPESPWLEKAQEWPVVGGLAQRFREAYLGPQRPPEAEEATAVEDEGPLEVFATEARSEWRPPPPKTQRRPIPAGPPPAIPERQQVESAAAAVRSVPTVELAPIVHRTVPSYIASEWRWLLPGHRIQVSAAPDAEQLDELTAMAYLPILERQGSWAEVMYRGSRGWVDTEWEPPGAGRGSKRGLLRHRYEPVRGSDWTRLKRARKLLGIERPERQLGAYKLFTDVEDEELLEFLDRAATVAEEAYTARYGRAPSGDPKRSVVLFAREADYRTYSESANIPTQTHAGHAGSGVLAFFAEGRPREELTRTLVHEITHLLNDRAVARVLPPWLEEGIASDLGAVWMEDGGGAERGGAAPTVGVTIATPEVRTLLLGPLLESGKLPSVAVLMSLDRETFHQPGVQSYAYAHGAAFVRFLLDGDDGRHAELFRTFLRRVAGGRTAEPRMLLKLLETEPEDLDKAFRIWLADEIEAQKEALNDRFARAVAR